MADIAMTLAAVTQLNQAGQPYCFAVQDGRIIGYWNWRDPASFPPGTVTNEIQAYRYIVVLSSDGTYTEVAGGSVPGAPGSGASPDPSLMQHTLRAFLTSTGWVPWHAAQTPAGASPGGPVTAAAQGWTPPSGPAAPVTAGWTPPGGALPPAAPAAPAWTSPAWAPPSSQYATAPAPAKKRFPLWAKVLIPTAVVVIAAMVVVGFTITDLVPTSDPDGELFLQNLEKADYTAAYAQLAPEVQQLDGQDFDTFSDKVSELGLSPECVATWKSIFVNVTTNGTTRSSTGTLECPHALKPLYHLQFRWLKQGDAYRLMYYWITG